jgi:Protein of unknown function (DUF3175)
LKKTLSGIRNKHWVAGVKTVSTSPPKGTFSGSAEEIARTMARKDVSPKGVGSGIRMIQYFINRAGKSIPATRREELEKAKEILQKRRAKKVTGKKSSVR